MVLTFLSHYVYLEIWMRVKFKGITTILQYICKSIKRSQIVLPLFAGSQSFPAHGMLQPTAASQTKSRCPSRSKLGILVLTSSGRCQPFSQPLAGPLHLPARSGVSHRVLMVPERTHCLRSQTETWLYSSHSAASWLCVFGQITLPPWTSLSSAEKWKQWFLSRSRPENAV